MKRLQTEQAGPMHRNQMFVQFRAFFQSCDSRSLSRLKEDSYLALSKLRAKFPEFKLHLHNPDTDTMQQIDQALQFSLDEKRGR